MATSPTKTAHADDDAVEPLAPTGNGGPIVTASTARAVAAKTRNTQLFSVKLAHTIAQDEESGRIVGLPDAIDPLTGKPKDGFKILGPDSEVDVTYDIGMSLISAGYVQVDPYDQGAIAVLFSKPKS